MRRLATQIHLTIAAALVLFAILVAAVWIHGPGMREEVQRTGAVADVVAQLLPGPDRPREDLQAEVARLADRLGVSAAVFSPTGERLASFGESLPLPRFRAGTHVSLGRARYDIALWLPDGRVLVAARPHAGLRHYGAAAVTLGLLSLVVALAAWPLVRRLTRRLENLRLRVEDLGGGDLEARAPVEGSDEVADLARSFNRAAGRIQQLVESQRRQLAFASHELRSPLARLRLSLEMMAGDPVLKERAAQDVAELDGLIDELLESSRLEARSSAERRDEVDLLALAAEEAARAGVEAEGTAVVVQGDARLLRRLVRNLLDNALRHGGGSPVSVRVEPREGGARLSVADRGPGIAPDERERVFEPFYRPRGTAETGAGYGLGLALVRQIARAHGGEARCLAREGGGTLLEVDLAS
ncbi:MAG: sensor histidine kinase [Betaproteobacteria bacterium]